MNDSVEPRCDPTTPGREELLQRKKVHRHRQAASGADRKRVDTDAADHPVDVPASPRNLDEAIVTRETIQSFSSIDDTKWGIELPFEVSLNVAPFEQIASFLSGPLILTRIPREVGAFGPTQRIIALYRRFGHLVASRHDIAGCYVLCECPDFKRYSKLTWEVLLRFVDHAGRRCQVLRHVRTPYDDTASRKPPRGTFVSDVQAKTQQARRRHRGR